MKLHLLVFVCLLFVGCQSGPQITLDSSNEKMVVRHFGPYFENDKFPVGGAVLVNAIITLGHERLPKDFRPERKLHYSDGQVEAVLEFYFTNLTDKPVELKIEDFKCRLFSGKIVPTIMIIPPKKWMKSTPVVAVTSNYVIDSWNYSMSVIINNQSYPVQDKLVRMTIEQQKARHE